MVHDGLVSSFDGRHMVEQASFVSRELGIIREDQDAWALRSQQRAAAAIDEGRFQRGDRARWASVDTDEAPRRDTSLEKLAKLRPVFDADGTTTAGNAPGCERRRGSARRRRARSSRGRAASRCWRRSSARRTSPTSSPTSPGTPAGAGNKVLEEAGKTIGDVRRVEVNEAFSSVAVNSLRMLDADPETVNVNGGAVALGHPIGASGARILSTLIYELRRSGRRARPRGHLLRRRPGRRAPDRGVVPHVNSSTCSSSGRARWAAASRRWSQRPAAACRSMTLPRARSSAAWRRCGAAWRSSPRRAGPIRTRCSRRVEPVDGIVEAELMIEAVVEDAAVKEAIFREADSDPPA